MERQTGKPIDVQKEKEKRKKKSPNLLKVFKDGIFSNNPVFVQMVGMCSVLAISSSLSNAIGMGAAVIFVLTLSNFIPDEVRIPAFIVVIASFVTMVQMLIKAYLPALDQSLGIFIPLIVVNCIILARAEGFASQQGPIASIVDGLGQGLGYTIAISILAAIRELFGNGTLLDNRISPEDFTIGFLIQPASSFIILGIMFAVANAISNKKKNNK